MFLVERFWVDPMENRDAYGWNIVGYVSTQEEADRITKLEYMRKSDYPWPLEYANEIIDERFSIYRITKLNDLHGLSTIEPKG